MLPVHVEGADAGAGAVAGPGDIISSKSTTGSSAHPSVVCFATLCIVFYWKGKVEFRSLTVGWLWRMPCLGGGDEPERKVLAVERRRGGKNQTDELPHQKRI